MRFKVGDKIWWLGTATYGDGSVIMHGKASETSVERIVGRRFYQLTNQWSVREQDVEPLKGEIYETNEDVID